MPEFNRTHITATTHEFKNNISRFTRLLETGIYKAVFVKRRNEVVGIYMTQGAKAAEKNFSKGARKEGRLPASSYEDDIFRNK